MSLKCIEQKNAMIQRRKKCRTENDQQEGDRKKCNEAVTMRCQISLAKMAKLLVDDARYNGKDENDLFGGHMLEDPKLFAKFSDSLDVPQRPEKKIESNMESNTKHDDYNRTPVVSSRKKLNHLPKPGAIDKLKYCRGDRSEGVLPSESWLKFVRKDANKSNVLEFSQTEQQSQSIFSRIVEVEQKSIENDPPNGFKPIDTDGPVIEKPANDDPPDSCSDKILVKASSVAKILIKPKQCSPSFELNKTQEAEDQSDIDSIVSKKRLSKYKSPPRTETNSKTKCDFYRYHISCLNGQRRRLSSSNELLRFGMKKNGTPDIDKVCINGSKVPRIDVKFKNCRTFKKATDKSDTFDIRQGECFEGWLPDSGGDSLEVTHCGGGISQYSFEDIHEKGPRTCASTPSLSLTDSNTPVSTVCSSVSFDTYHSPRSDLLYDRTKSSLDDFITDRINSKEIRELSSSASSVSAKKSVGGNTTSSASSHRICLEGECIEQQMNSNADEEEEGREKEDGNDNGIINPSDCNSDDRVTGNSNDDSDIGNNGDNAEDTSDYNKTINPHDSDDHVNSDRNDNVDVDDNIDNADDSGDYNECGGDYCCSDVNNISSGLSISIDSCTSNRSYIKVSRKLLQLRDDASDSFCSDTTNTTKADTDDAGQYFWSSECSEKSMPIGYYEGISARYIQPVVVPPPFPGRDRAKMIMKVKGEEAKKGMNIFVKFKSEIKDSTHSSTKIHPECRDGTNVVVKNYKLDIKDNELKLKKGQTTRRLLYQNPDYKPMNKNSSSFVERNIQSVNLPRLKTGQKNVLRLPVIDCDLKVLSQMNGGNLREV